MNNLLFCKDMAKNLLFFVKIVGKRLKFKGNGAFLGQIILNFAPSARRFLPAIFACDFRIPTISKKTLDKAKGKWYNKPYDVVCRFAETITHNRAISSVG